MWSEGLRVWGLGFRVFEVLGELAVPKPCM